ncbi:unnamed protein product [Polarella glacialis]|nr:unnamed protein product [Polarella glacialis]
MLQLRSGQPEVAYKAADVAQMLIVHREAEPPGAARCLDRSTFKWRSGLTPPARLISQRKFRGVPRPESMFSRERIAEATQAIRDRMVSAPFVYEEETEVDEATLQELQQTQPENIWRPPPPAENATAAVLRSAVGERGSGSRSFSAPGGKASASRVSDGATGISSTSGGRRPEGSTSEGDSKRRRLRIT